VSTVGTGHRARRQWVPAPIGTTGADGEGEPSGLGSRRRFARPGVAPGRDPVAFAGGDHRHPARRAKRHLRHNVVAMGTSRARADGNVVLFMQEYVVDTHSQRQQGQGGPGEVDNQQRDVSQPGLVGKAQANLEEQHRRQDQDGIGQPSSTRVAAA